MRVLAAAAFAAIVIAPARAQPLADADLPPWRVPDIATLPDDADGRAIRYGRALIDHTAALIGPDAREPAMRFSGNGLDCQNCHLDGGTARFGLPLVGIWSLYPKFSARVNAMQTMADRINDCMQRSMNGRKLPADGRELDAIVAYIRFLGTGQPDHVAPVGRGAPKLALPERAADPAHGAAVFQANCASCHRSDGQGVRYSAADTAEKRRRYLFPPLWGPESYNDGAGMSRNIAAAWFIRANMPRGVTFAYPLLDPGDAYDVAAYVNAQPRPHFAGLASDYPDPWLKPADVPTPPWLGPFPPSQHTLGPWQPIEAWLRANMQGADTAMRSANDLESALAPPPGPAPGLTR